MTKLLRARNTRNQHGTLNKIWCYLVGGLNFQQAVLSGETRDVKRIGVILLSIVISIANSILRVMTLHAETALII